MTLHVFNPEHDIALAANMENFTAPHAGRQLRHDLGFLPALWAKAGDVVLVDDRELAETSLHRMAVAARKILKTECGFEGVELVTAPTVCAESDKLDSLHWTASPTTPSLSLVDPWGWDLALRGRLRRMGVSADVLPDDTCLEQLRQLSHRRTAAILLRRLTADGIPGITGEEPAECTTMDETAAAMARHTRAVLKAPWSSSGRGLRFVGSPELSVATQSQQTELQRQGLTGWLRNVLARQGGIMVEPYYDKVKDFGMEFMVMADGSVAYCGLSLFHTANGAYTGNILATEQRKREMIGRYIPLETIDRVKESICCHLAAILKGRYHGPLGVDMMIVHGLQSTVNHIHPCAESDKLDPLQLMPCVEINMRRTMGHAALSLTPKDDDLMGVMRIENTGQQMRMSLHSHALR